MTGRNSLYFGWFQAIGMPKRSTKKKMQNNPSRAMVAREGLFLIPYFKEDSHADVQAIDIY